MDAEKKARKVHRSAFTKSLNSFREKCSNANVSFAERSVALQLLESKMTQLECTQSKYVELLIASCTSEDDIGKEIESHEAYKEEYLTARMTLLGLQDNLNSTATNANVHENVPRSEKPFKRPTLEIPSFDGNISSWLKFWSHFQKIDKDAAITNEDKLAYLKQAMEKGSKAESVIEGFPVTSENYAKALSTLKNRFGRDDFLVEHYTRELLSLVLQKANNKGKKISVASIYDKVSAHVRALETLGIKTKECATMLYPLVESSLPEEILRTWQRVMSSGEAAVGEGEENKDRLTRLLDFLQLEVENEERVHMAVNGFIMQSGNERQSKVKDTKGKSRPLENLATASALYSNEVKNIKCIFCGENHDNAACEKAKKMTLDSRKSLIKENGCCFKCLKRGHRSKDCHVKLNCAWCGKRHAILVCSELRNSHYENKVEKPIEKHVTEQTLANFCSLPDVCLLTLRVVLYSETKQKVVRAVIDNGCTRTYIRSDVAEYLGYKPVGSKEIVHKLFGGASSENQTHNIFTVRMKSINEDYACNLQAMDQRIICDNIARAEKADWLNELERKNITLSDFSSTEKTDDSISFLIGADIFGKLLTGKKLDLTNGLTAIETKLGWTISSKVPTSERKDTASEVVSMFVTDAKISELWSLDVLGIRDPIEKSDSLLREQAVKDQFLKTVRFKGNGRYSVDLPWIENHAPLSNNLNLAQTRLEKTVTKLKKEGQFDKYLNVFNEWCNEEIVEFVPEGELNYVSHYLAHRPVIKPGSTTEIRPVFDASAAEIGKPSLNNCLEKGPNCIEQIPASLLKFREGEIGVLADIRKAFLQIEVNEKDRDFLRFLLLINGVLKSLRNKRVVFGLTCSPFLLGAVLEFHFLNILRDIKNSKWSAEIVKKLAKSFYVDNCLTSVESTDELNLFISTAIEVMKKGSFDLRGWEFTHDSSEKRTTLVLGILFDKTQDTLSINPTVLEKFNVEKVNKRTILSIAHRVFDPIGFTSPVTLLPKLLLKELWKSKKDWDSTVDSNTQKKFFDWLNQLPYLKFIAIPRKFGKGNISLHTFCDASRDVYATVTFLRIESEEGVKLRLVAAKSRIAPDKATIPRLELLAASIGSRQANEIINALEYDNVTTFYWSDSTTVLAWLNRDSQWGIYVWNRVREIRALTKSGKWRYVPGEMNPADLPSRGCQAKELLDSRWWEGPEWLCEPEDSWPNITGNFDEKEIDSELKKSVQFSMFSKENQTDLKIVERFSSYTKLIRFFAIIIRFVNFKRNVNINNDNRLTYGEIYKAELKYLKFVQQKTFKSEKDPRLTKLQVFVHTDGLIRLKTKISERDDHFSFLYPIILDYKEKVVQLLIRETHENMGHAGVQTVMCQLRERFWILKARKTIRSVIEKCITCKRSNVKAMQVDPAPLPLHRVRDAAVFEITGVDFAGPVFLRGQQKAWICLYTCAVYRAVHLELVTSLSTREFLSCFRRFIARRGRPVIMYSDNGSNFIGANNLLDDINWQAVSKFSCAQRVEWRFNPPTAAWWGGWWERLIGMLKNILRKVLGKSCLTYEELCTVLCDCENTLNSRPLTYISDETNDLKPLTPAMFLRDLKESETPDLDIIDQVDLKSRYKYKQELMEHLRSRFRKEYLSQLIIKSHTKESRRLKVGDVVLVGDDSRKRIDWPLARIEELIEGRDGKSRVVVVKTSTGSLKRPLQRIYPLEISDCIDDSTVLREKVKENVRNKETKEESIYIQPKEHCAVKENRTSSGRLVKKPDYYNCKPKN